MPIHVGVTRDRARRAACVLFAAVVVCGLLLAAPWSGAQAASAQTASTQARSTHAAAAQTETALSETGWTASSNTNSSSADAPQNAIGGTSGPRFSSDAYQAPGMWFEVNLGSAQTFNQVELN